jgi:hypothetical protein
MRLIRIFGLGFPLGLVNGVIDGGFDTFEDIYGAPEGWEVVDSNPTASRIEFQIALHAVC